MRIVITLKRGEDSATILNRLYKFTQLQVSFGIIMLALDAKNQPITFDLKGMLVSFIEHRKDVVTKRCFFDLKKAQEKAHILEGLFKALSQIDEVIQTIKSAKEAKEAQASLVSKFGFTIPQATAILEMRLQRLTGLEREKIEAELLTLKQLIEHLSKVLSDVQEIYKIVKNELLEIKEKFGDERKSQIIDDGTILEDEDLIADEEMIVTVTNTGYIKRISSAEYKVQHRGGKGLKGMNTRDEDTVTRIFAANTKTTLLVFTDKGRLYWCKVYRLPEGNRNFKGKAIANVVNLLPDEKIQAILPVTNFADDRYVVMLTKKGVIKKTSLAAFKNITTRGVVALTTDIDDCVLDVKLSDGKSDLFIATSDSMAIRFPEEQVRPIGRTARGVVGISLGKDDHCVGLEVIGENQKESILVFTDLGFGKRTEVDEYRVQRRGGIGTITQKTTDRIGKLVGTRKLTDVHELILTTDKGQVIRIKASEIRVVGRNTQGVRLINLSDSGERLTDVAVIENPDNSIESHTEGANEE
jgi:DNA gyrase subunit A